MRDYYANDILHWTKTKANDVFDRIIMVQVQYRNASETTRAWHREKQTNAPPRARNGIRVYTREQRLQAHPAAAVDAPLFKAKWLSLTVKLAKTYFRPDLSQVPRRQNKTRCPLSPDSTCLWLCYMLPGVCSPFLRGNNILNLYRRSFCCVSRLGLEV